MQIVYENTCGKILLCNLYSPLPVKLGTVKYTLASGTFKIQLFSISVVRHRLHAIEVKVAGEAMILMGRKTVYSQVICFKVKVTNSSALQEDRCWLQEPTRAVLLFIVHSQPKENFSQSVIVFSGGQHGLTHECAGPLLVLERQRKVGRTWKDSGWDRLWNEIAV